LVLLFIAGFVELSFDSMAQALVQLIAPAPIRGRVIGVFSMAASGMRTFSGLKGGNDGRVHRDSPLAGAERRRFVRRNRLPHGIRIARCQALLDIIQPREPTRWLP
jgi:hypothetical protein